MIGLVIDSGVRVAKRIDYSNSPAEVASRRARKEVNAINAGYRARAIRAKRFKNGRISAHVTDD